MVNGKIDDFKLGESKTYYFNDFNKLKFNGASLILLQFKNSFRKKLKTLLNMNLVTQNSRVETSVGFQIRDTQTSYQGEINPFPSKQVY